MARLMGMLITTLAVAVGVLLLVWTGQRRLIYFPSVDVPSPPTLALADVEDAVFETEDGLTLSGWFVDTGSVDATATVLVFNGNAGHRGHRTPLAAALRTRGVQVLLVDYRGYGGNPGAPTETGLRADARAARRHVLGRADVRTDRLFYLGESLGTAVAIGLAAESPPAGLILRSPFPSLVEVGRLHYPFLPVRHLLRDRFASVEPARSLRAPVLVLAGRRDRIVPLEQSRALYDAIPTRKELVILPGGHNDPALLAGEELVDAIVRFIDTVVTASAPSPALDNRPAAGDRGQR